MSDMFVTFHGWVGGEVAYRNPNGISVANFRVACTPRLKRKGDWVDAETTWYSVTAWRTLAENVRDSIRKGDAVIVHGRLRSESWKREDGQLSTGLIVEASFVGHDLARGTSTFTKSARPERADSDVHTEIQDMVHRPFDDSVRPDSWGDPIEAERDAPELPDPGPLDAMGPGAAA
jgi:single-strand DNA-binding protein